MATIRAHHAFDKRDLLKDGTVTEEAATTITAVDGGGRMTFTGSVTNSRWCQPFGTPYGFSRTRTGRLDFETGQKF